MRLFHTIRYLRPSQLWYRVVRPIQKRFYREVDAPGPFLDYSLQLPLIPLFTYSPYDRYSPQTRSFSLLNLSTTYPTSINWNDKSKGLLWGYHLNYFGWLEDESLSVEDRLSTITAYISAQNIHEIGNAPYPTSLRSISWIRFFIRHGHRSKGSAAVLYQDLHRLYSFPEYELDGNHLWENGASLLIGGLYFNNTPFFNTGLNILRQVLAEQIGTDGGHVEGSPMYHCLLLLRLFFCIELLEKIPHDYNALEINLFKQKAGEMLGWVKRFTFSDGTMPMVNDSAFEIAPSFAILEKYADQIGIVARTSSSGPNRMYRSDIFELFSDVAGTTCNWQPGHTHADTFTFCLHAFGKSLIVDTGVSTYNIGPRRQYERGTSAHNTITINDKNSSDTWRSFRLGRRAEARILNEGENFVNASHNGYIRQGVKHIRSIIFAPDKIIIEDILEGKIAKGMAVLHLHFHPDVILNKCDEGKYQANGTMIVIDGANHILKEDYQYCAGFNKLLPAQRLKIEVKQLIKITIERTDFTC